MPAERFYLDSNVLVSLLREEMNGNFRLLFKEADAFFKYVEKSKAIIVVSDLFFYEVEEIIHLKKENVTEYLAFLNVRIEQVESTRQDSLEAKKFEAMGIHDPDSKHLAIAIRVKCNCIVTFNKKDFERAMSIIKIKDPQDFI